MPILEERATTRACPYGYAGNIKRAGCAVMRWLELTVKTHPEAVESVSELLSRYTPGGVAIEEPIELIDEGQDYRVLVGQPVAVHAYLPIDGQEEEAYQRVAEGLWHFSSLGEHFVGELQTRIV